MMVELCESSLEVIALGICRSWRTMRAMSPVLTPTPEHTLKIPAGRRRAAALIDSMTNCRLT
jgi:hypothetical protein